MLLTWFSWYFSIVILGLVVFPITYFLFPKLEDKGYLFSKTIGLFLWGYIYWILTSFNLTKNSISGVLIVLIMLILISLFLLIKIKKETILIFFQQNIKTIIIAELLFILFFLGWTIMRAAMPNVDGTEKPMELAFINSILKSPVFPPNDPWLSGFSISYYYFGYVIVSILIRFTGVPSGIGFNLAIALWSALTAVSAYGVLYNLLASYQNKNKNIHISISALLAPFFILIVSNLEGFLEVLHAKGLFWNQFADGNFGSKFWSWLNILELNSPPAQPFTWIPNRPNGIIWWRASRVLSDFNIAGTRFEVIDEFPFFSFFLADLHPHVLAMPFVLITIGLAFQFYLILKDSGFINIKSWIKRSEFWVIALLVGGLGFLNTWDFPTYTALFAAIYAYFSYLEFGWSRRILLNFLYFGLSLGVIGFLLFLPYYIGFSSQAGGFLPSISFYTRGIHFWIMFAPLLVPIFIWLISKVSHNIKNDWLVGFKFSAIVVFGLWLASYLFGLLITGFMGNQQGSTSPFIEKWITASNQFLGLHAVTKVSELLGISIENRLLNPGTWITLLLLISFIWMILKKNRDTKNISTQFSSYSDDNFVILLIFLGTGLTLFPEFFYLRDQFATRMNTIFKFYFQTWIIWGIAASYSLVLIWQKRSTLNLILKVFSGLILVMSVAYPLFMIGSTIRPNNFNTLTLDGNNFRKIYTPLDYEAILWLQNRPNGTIAEAVGGSYSGFARFATLTGNPSVLGWVGHELQWRGGTTEMGSRENDLRELYETNDWNITEKILDNYSIQYIIVGSFEKSTYRVNDLKFREKLPIVFENQEVVIYENKFFQ